MTESFGWTSPSYDQKREAPQPPDGTVQVFHILKAEPKMAKTTPPKPTISIFGDFPEWAGARWSGTIWLPVDEGDGKYQEKVNRFLDICQSFGLENPGGKGPGELCDLLRGSYAQARVVKSDYGLEPRWFKDLTDEQKVAYRGSAAAADASPAATVEDPNPFG